MKHLLFFSLLILPVSLFAEGGLPDKPYIYVEGRAEIKKPADVVTLSFNVVGRAPDQPKANEDVQSKANKIFALLKESKVADNDVIAEDLSSEPEYEQDDNYSRGHTKLIGYKVTRPFQVKVRDIAAFPRLADELVNIQGVEFSGVDAGLVKEKEIEPEVWQRALENARDKAEKTLKPLNMKVESVFAVSPISFREIEGRMFAAEGVTRLGVRLAEERGPPSPVQPEYRLAPVTVTQSVNVIYLISPAK